MTKQRMSSMTVYKLWARVYARLRLILQYKTKMMPKEGKTLKKMECTHEVGTGLTACTIK
jgi:DNA-binding CsgD family transcriptional regulator